MKTKYLLLLMLSFVFFQAQAQYCPVRPYSNSWDWTLGDYYDGSYYYYDSYITSVNNGGHHFLRLKSPFTQDDNPNVFNFDQLAKADVDFYPQDGWVLIRKRLGTSDIDTEDQPYFILYNKYSGVLRVFVAIFNAAQNNSAMINVSFLQTGSSWYESNLLKAKAFSDPSDNFTKKSIMKVPNVFVNSTQGFWLYGDFPTNYDPCTCLFDSDLLINVSLIQSGSLSLNSVPVVNNGATGGPGASGSSSSFAYINKVLSYGDKIYTNIDEAKKNYNTLANNQDSTLRITMNSAFKLMSAVAGGASGEIGLIQNISGLLDYFVKGGSTSKNASVSSNETKINATGAIVFTDPYQNATFKTPGANNLSATDRVKPVYNNTLGTFNLLRTPVLDSYSYQCDGQLSGYCKLPFSFIPVIKEFKLNLDSLKYVVNPASNLIVEDIRAAIVFTPFILANVNNYTPAPDFTNNRFVAGPVEISPNLNKNLYQRMSDIGLEIENWPISNQMTEMIFRTPYLPLGCLSNRTIKLFQYGDTEKSIFLKLIVTLKRTDDPNAPKVTYLAKYPVKLNQLTDRGSYSIPIAVSGSCYSVTGFPTRLSPSPFSSLPFYNTTTNGSFDNTTFDYYSPFFLAGHVFSYSSFSINNSTISGPLEMKAGREVVMTAGSAIIANQHGTPLILMNGISLKAGDPTNTSDCLNAPAYYAADASTIQSFCNNKSWYKPLVSAARISYDKSSSNNDENKIDHLYPAYPNPFTITTTLRYEIIESGPVRLTVTNIWGREITTLVNTEYQEAGKYSKEFNGTNLPDGIYFYTLKTAKFQETKRLVVIK